MSARALGVSVLAAFATLLTLTAWPARQAGAQEAQPRPGRGEGREGRPGGGEGREGRPGGQEGREGRPGGRGGRETPGVEGSMKMMDRGLRQLKEQVGDASKLEDNLKLLGDMQRGCVFSKTQAVPKDVLQNATSDADKAKLTENYRRHLLAAMRKLLDIEQDLLDGKGDAARRHLDEFTKMRDDGHKAMGFKEKDEVGPQP